MRHPLRLLLTVTALGACTFLSFATAEEDAGVVVFSNIPDKQALIGEVEYSRLKKQSEKESVLQMIFGTDCYSTALAKMERTCNDMSSDDQYKMAHAMTNCFLKANGHKGYECTDRMTPGQCSSNLHDRAYTTYNSIFQNIHSICLHISNRAFEKHTAHLLNKLHEGAGAAQSVLHGIVNGLQGHQKQQQLLQKGISEIRQEQSGLTEGLREGLHRLSSIQGQAHVLQEQVNKTLAMEMELALRQGDLARQMVTLEELELQHAAASAQRWEALQRRAEQMEDRQAQYEALQEALAASSHQLLAQSGELQGAISTVLVAQQRTSSLLARVLGGQWTLKDLSFYAAAVSTVYLLTGSSTSLQSARLPLLALLFLTAAGERVVRQYLQIWLPLIDGAMGLSPMTPFIGKAEHVCFLLRILSGLVAIVLLMRRLMTTRRRESDDRRMLANLQLQLEQLSAQQTLLIQYLSALPAPSIGPDALGQFPSRTLGQLQSAPLLYGQATAGMPALLAAPPPVAVPMSQPVMHPVYTTRDEWVRPAHVSGGGPAEKSAAPQARQHIRLEAPSLDTLMGALAAAAAATPVPQSIHAVPELDACAAQPQPRQQEAEAMDVEQPVVTTKGDHSSSSSKRKREAEPDDGQCQGHGRAKARREHSKTGR